jgi:hypothetical protein
VKAASAAVPTNNGFLTLSWSVFMFTLKCQPGNAAISRTAARAVSKREWIALAVPFRGP